MESIEKSILNTDVIQLLKERPLKILVFLKLWDPSKYILSKYVYIQIFYLILKSLKLPI